ncbi:SE-cephalotoxin-like [Alosa sapidissima]|uniref:SE-cephalotoxin-like n=1 Tax=Alosa sapidissima TaxID=34773 RepID=UPI001C09BED0|nr:SE-cephalotoxin-like [Alosa sapidissima]
MATLRICVSLLCVLLCVLIGQSEGQTGDREAAVLMDKTTSSFSAAHGSLTDLVNIANTLTHSHNQSMLKDGLEAFDGVAKLVPFMEAFGSLVRFTLGFVPKTSPHVTYMKRRFRQVSRELDSLSAQVRPLPSMPLWPSEEEGVLLNGWAQLEQLVASLAAVDTPEERTRAAERFTGHCESRGTEDGVMSFHRRVTESSPLRGQSLLQLIWEQSEGDVRVLTRFSSYVTALMIRGSFVSTIYDKLKSERADLQRALPAAEHLLSLSKFLQRRLLDCTDGYAAWVRKDVEEIMTGPFSEIRSMATDIKAHLDAKFSWFTWTVIVLDSSLDYGFTYGYSITMHSQGRAVYLVPRSSEAEVDAARRVETHQKMEKNKHVCPLVQENMSEVFPSSLVKQMAFAHATPESLDYTTVGDTVTVNCYTNFMFITTGTYINTVVLKSMGSLDHPSCSMLKCRHGTCRQAQNSSVGFCLCETGFYGRSCENDIWNEIRNSRALKEKISSVNVNPVPDKTAVYFRVQEQARHAEARERLHWVKLRYQDVMDKLSFLSHQAALLKGQQISTDRFVSNVGDILKTEGAFTYLLFQFDNMLRGNKGEEDSSLLEALQELLLHPKDPSVQPHDPIACSATYAEKLDDFVMSVSTLRSEGVSAWEKYFIFVYGKPIDPTFVNTQNLSVGTGCGPLSADHLVNSHCQRPHHSADQQRVQLKCSGSFKAFPETAQCSNGRWSALPVCYTEPRNGATQCRTENGTTVCEASCDHSAALLPSGERSEVYRCSGAPCRPFSPSGPCAGPRCSSSSMCEDSEVCHAGRCVDGCSSSPCGANGVCATFNHAPVCTCVVPWLKNRKQECRLPSLHWAEVTHIPNGTVKSPSGKRVCRATGPGGDWHSGWLYTVAGRDSCLFGYDGKTMRATKYELLLDPCESKGYLWIPGGPHSDSMWAGYTTDTPGRMLFVCSWWEKYLDSKHGFPGTLAQTAEGYKCTIALNRAAHTTSTYLTLVRVQSCPTSSTVGRVHSHF